MGPVAPVSARKSVSPPTRVTCVTGPAHWVRAGQANPSPVPAAGWPGLSQRACGAAASQLVGGLQYHWPFAVFWFMAGASVLALAAHRNATR